MYRGGLRIAAFLNNTGTALYAQTPSGTASSVDVALAFPANTGAANRVYTIRVSVDGGANWLATPTATVTVAGTPQNNNQGQGNNNQGGGSGGNGGGQTRPSLSTPTNVRINNTIVSWNTVNNATGYRVYVGGRAISGTITARSFDLAELELAAGTHAIRVRAIYSGTRFNNSGLSATVNFVVQATYPDYDDAPPIVPPADVHPPVYIPWINPFTDVNESDWFFNSIRFVHQNNLFSGTTATTFGPGTTMTRGMMVTVLHRMAGRPDTSGLSNIFTDVTDGAWYDDAIRWAAAKGIVSGIGDQQFAPNNPITREQMAAILNRYATHMGIELVPIRTGAFGDATEISAWAMQSVNAMYAAGIISGRGGGIFDPQGNATRAEVATLLRNFMEATQTGPFGSDNPAMLRDEDLYFDHREDEDPELDTGNEDDN